MDALDAVDRTVLDLLRDDGRLSVNELATRAGISRPNAYARINRLRERGVITGFTVKVDPKRAGLPVAALVLVNAHQSAWKELAERFRELPWLEWMGLTTGSFDFLLLVRVPDVDALRDVVLGHLQAMPDVRATQTLFLLDEVEARS